MISARPLKSSVHVGYVRLAGCGKSCFCRGFHHICSGHSTVKSVKAGFFSNLLGVVGAVACVALSACGSVSSSGSNAIPPASEAASPVASEAASSAASDAVEIGTEAVSPGIEPTAIATEPSTTIAALIEHLPDAVTVPFDVTRNDARPLKETMLAVEKPVDVLSMKVTGIAYRGMICGFSIQGTAPTSPLTIRQIVTTPAGTFDSGPIDVSWTALDDAAVTAGTAQIGTWNFSAEAHVNRSGPGWVVSIGGVTASRGGDDKDVTPTEGGCELRSANTVFTPETGPVGYWAGFATV